MRATELFAFLGLATVVFGDGIEVGKLSYVTVRSPKIDSAVNFTYTDKVREGDDMVL